MMKALGCWCPLVSSILVLCTLQADTQQLRQTLARHVPPAVSTGVAQSVGPLPATKRLNLSIVLPLRNQDQLISLLSKLYDPSSPDYRHFLTVAEFTDQFGPREQDFRAVTDYVEAYGMEVSYKPVNRLVVPISGTVDQIQRAFHVAMRAYWHPAENREFFSADREPSLDLSVPLAHIAGLNNNSLPRSAAIKGSSALSLRSAMAQGSGPAGTSFLSSDMRAAYYGGNALTGSGQTVGLLQFDGYNISDVTASFDGTASAIASASNYILTYTPTAGGTTYTIPVNNVLLDGATGNPGQFISKVNDSEQVLDIVQAVGMAPGLSQVRVYIGSSDVDILNKMASENIAQQLSISWTWSPDDPLTDDVFFEEFAAQGQSVFAASGDYGAYSPSVPYYYPAEDAWVTAVGGTSLTTNGAGGAITSEIAWNQSGGGISPDQIEIPSWQAGVANSSNGASSTLRNVPDVAMEADFDNYDCNMGTCSGDWAGTSFAAPRWAGFMALVNQQAVANGDTSVGFMNPWLYLTGASADYGSEFHDIDAGENGYESGYEFHAVTGYDLVTGWGSPAGQNLIDSLAPPKSPVGFQLATSASSLTINPGCSGTATIAVIDRGGFAGSVNLSVSSHLPSGVTASFDTNPTSGTSVLTITASVSAVSGSYLITVTGTSGAASATTNVNVSTPMNAVTISSPVMPQVPVTSLMFKPGTPIPIQGTVLGSFLDLRLEWAPGINATTGWSSLGMTVSGRITSPAANQTVGTWDTSSIVAANYYTIRLSVDYPDATVSATTLVYLEPDLISANWPKWLDINPKQYSGVIPVVSGSGNPGLGLVESKSLITTGQPRYRVFSVDGSSDQTTALIAGTSFNPAFGNLTAGDGGESVVGDSQDILVLTASGASHQLTSGADNVEFDSSQVVLAGLKGDSSLETVALGYQTTNNLAFVYAWGSDGQLLNSNYPIQVPFHFDLWNYPLGLAVGDIDGDGKQEIVVQEMPSATTFSLALFANDGTARSWAAPTFQGIPGQMILADIDHNGKLEVILDVFNTDTKQSLVHILEPDGSERNGWPIILGQSASNFVNLAAGDLARTGYEQIVVSDWDNLYVLNGDGTSFSNAWPLTISHLPNTIGEFGPVVLADIDGDGYPEILVTTNDLAQTNSSAYYNAPALRAFHRDGTLAKSWKLLGMNGNQPTTDFSANITVGDFNQDGMTEIAVDTGLIYGGGTNGWDTQGVMEVLKTGTPYNAAANDWPMLYRDAHNSATAASAHPVMPQAAIPVITPAGGTYSTTQTRWVTISDATPGAIIYYTTNGTTPDSSSSVYNGSIAVSYTESVEAIAIASGDAPSPIATALYTFPKWADPPDFSPYPGTYDQELPVTVTISDTTPGAMIYYTTDGSTPTTGSTLYSSPITVSKTETIRVLVVATGYLPIQGSMTYTVTPPPAAPTFLPPAGTYTTSQTVSISDATPGTTIYYTTNGLSPNIWSSPVYSVPITVSSSETIQAMAWENDGSNNGYNFSNVALAPYVILPPPAATPMILPSAGTYTTPQTVSISDATPSAVIYYTTDGSTPTTGSPVYSLPITVSASETIQAMASSAGYSASSVASAPYVIMTSVSLPLPTPAPPHNPNQPPIPPAAAPTFLPPAGTYTMPLKVTISDASAGAVIFYTTDGSTPTSGSPVYSMPITVSARETIHAIASGARYSASSVASAPYVVKPPVPLPVPEPAPHRSRLQSPIPLPVPEIGNTTNGNTPNTRSSVYSVPITVSASETIQTTASGARHSASTVASVPHTITSAVSVSLELSSISPVFTSAGRASFPLTITGTGFTSSAVVYWGATALSTQFVSTTQVTAQVPPEDTMSPGVIAISVQTPAPNATTSNTLQFEIVSAQDSTAWPSFTNSTATVAPGLTANYPVTLPASATDVSVSCLNLPSDATCGYSSASGLVTITTK
jgi:hypothetical protein